MEPIDGAGQFGKDLPEPVTTSDMCQLMSKYDAEPVLGPLSSAGRQQDRRPENSPRQGHGAGVTGKKYAYGKIDSKRAGALRNMIGPGLLCERYGAGRNSREKEEAQDKAKQDEKKTGEPDQQKDSRQLVESWRGGNRVNDCRGKRLRSGVAGKSERWGPKTRRVA